jgi:hypothetical protein
VVIDRIEQQADAKPFNPRIAVVKFAAVMREYHLSRIMGDCYAGVTFRSEFMAHSIGYTVCPWSKSELYEALEPAINAGEVELLDEPKLQEQLLTLARRGAKIDHEPNGHDDWANAVAGVVWLIRSTLRQNSDVVICAPIVVGEPRVQPPGAVLTADVSPVLAPPEATNNGRPPKHYLKQYQQEDPAISWSRSVGSMRRWSPPPNW